LIVNCTFPTVKGSPPALTLGGFRMPEKIVTDNNTVRIGQGITFKNFFLGALLLFNVRPHNPCP
jgi:hypothetical protein